MSHPARGPRSGIDGQANAAGGRPTEVWNEQRFSEAERMSHPARGPLSGIELGFDQSGLEGVGTGTTVRPGRGRTQPKSENSEKVRTVPPASRKKSPPARKAPARGRYVDEYARPF
jgi:hypothetical protein